VAFGIGFAERAIVSVITQADALSQRIDGIGQIMRGIVFQRTLRARWVGNGVDIAVCVIGVTGDIAIGIGFFNPAALRIIFVAQRAIG
jgi:hypothetical protein